MLHPIRNRMSTRSAAFTFLLVSALRLACAPAALSAQELDRQEVLTAAREVIATARLATLVTLDSTGHPQARIMDPLPPDQDFVVYMASNPLTRKVAQIERDARTTLYYFDPAGPSFVTLVGFAEIVTDPLEREHHWKEDWAPHYDNDPTEKNFRLIRFRPARLEMMSVEHGMMADPGTWRPVTVEFEVE
jgi:general stress protein 26